MKIQKISLFLLCVMPVTVSYGMESSLTPEALEKIKLFQKFSEKMHPNPLHKKEYAKAESFNSTPLCYSVDNENGKLIDRRQRNFYNSITNSSDENDQALGEATLKLREETICYYNTDTQNEIGEQNWIDVAPLRQAQDTILKKQLEQLDKNKYFWEHRPALYIGLAFLSGIGISSLVMYKYFRR